MIRLIYWCACLLCLSCVHEKRPARSEAGKPPIAKEKQPNRPKQKEKNLQTSPKETKAISEPPDIYIEGLKMQEVAPYTEAELKKFDSLARLSPCHEEMPDSVFWARLKRIDTTIVGKGLRLHCKWIDTIFHHEEPNAAYYAKRNESFKLPYADYLDFWEKEENGRIAQNAPRVRKTASHLAFHLADGRWYRLKQYDAPAHLARKSRFMGYWEKIGVYWAHISPYEGEFFLLVDAKGREKVLTGLPTFSPAYRYGVATQYKGGKPAWVYVSEFFHLYSVDNPEKCLAWNTLIPSPIQGGLGRVKWLNETTFLMEVCACPKFLDASGDNVACGVVRCEIKEKE